MSVWDSLSRRVVMVSRYAERDGIGRYADQLAAASPERTFVRVGIPEGPGDYHRTFHRPPWALWLLRDAAGRDDVVLHYHPHYYLRGGTINQALSYLSWALLGRMRRIVLIPHEVDEREPRALEPLRRLAWRRPRVVVFHSEWERERFAGRFGRGRRQRHEVVVHGDFFAAEVRETRAQARATLGLAEDRVILLMIGFLSPDTPDKGYDRAIDAVRAIADPRLELHVVGSPIREAPEVDALLAYLRGAQDSGVRLHEQYVDDEAFDRWVIAADAVLTPYRASSSSGVMARAQLLGTPVITSDVGGLAEQAGPHDVVVRDDAELSKAIHGLL